MFTRPTLFIVGAGASAEANLPTGNRLKSSIAKLIDIRFDNWGDKQETGDRCVCAALRQHTKNIDENPNINPYLHAARQIGEALPLAISIDNYLEAHSGNEKIELCGKLGIAKSILDAERQSKLFIDHTNANNTLNTESLRDTWYNSFFQTLTEGCTLANIEHLFTNVSIITFNYDRCIEHYLYHTLQIYYKLTPEESAKIMGNLKIIHPYGQVGKYPWNDVPDSIQFGSDIEATRLLQTSQQIKTFTETINSEEGNNLRKLLQDAETLIFLGFAYHKQNMEIMTLHETSNVTKIFGTAKGFSQSDTNVIQDQLLEFLSIYQTRVLEHINLDNQLTCVKLFDNFRLTMTQ